MTVRVTSLAAVAGIVALAWWLWPTEEGRVKARISALARALTSAPGESDLERMTRTATLTSSLASDVTVGMGNGRDVVGREAVLASARQLLLTRSSVQVEARDVRVHVDASGTTAAAALVVVVDGDSVHEVALEFDKVDHVWLVREARVVLPLDRPALTR